MLILVAKAEAQTSALAISDSLYAVGEYEEAIEVMEGISDNSERIHQSLAKYNWAAGNSARASEHYEKLLELNPKRLLTAIDYGKLLVKTGKLSKADSLFSSLTNKYPENANFYYQRALIKEKQQDSLAWALYMHTIALDKTHQGALYKIAREELKNRRYTMAEVFSKQGLEANPDNVSLLSILAQTYFSIKEYRKSIPLFEILLDLGQELPLIPI